MAVEKDIVRIAGAIVGDRMYADTAPANTPRPFGTYQQVGGRPLAFLESIQPDLQNGRFQISVWADTRQEASTLMRAIAKAMVEAPELRAEALGNTIAQYDPVTELRGAIQDFSIWFRD
ncbi:DUF3168 domain-containing protein [Pigmentiphaga daeguensis]|uniref:DUF3168 domain-containing protein n=1 Tax=Pigmentiphaga daeguensis TaxID=414049 RepID=A0ABN1BAP2_9BURK